MKEERKCKTKEKPNYRKVSLYIYSFYGLVKINQKIHPFVFLMCNNASASDGEPSPARPAALRLPLLLLARTFCLLHVLHLQREKLRFSTSGSMCSKQNDLLSFY